MIHTCPQCGSQKVRHATHAEGHRLLRSAFRCRRCNAQFWAIAGRTWLRIGVLGVLLATAGFTALVLWQLDRGEDDLDVAGKVQAARLRDGSDDYAAAQKYLGGVGVPRDVKEGALLLERSAQQGYVKAQYELAVALRDGTGVVADDQRALTWFRMAAEAGDSRAQHQVGLMYMQGRGTKADAVKGYAWLTVAAANGAVGAAEARDVALAAMSEAEIALAGNEARRLATTQRVARDNAAGRH